jgi:hypothetical protein
VAFTASSSRLDAPTLSKMRVRWCLTVSSLTVNLPAISLFVHPAFARRERGARLRGGRLGRLTEGSHQLDQITDQRLPEPVASPDDRHDGLEQHLRGRIFLEKTADSKLDRCEQVRSVDDARKHDRAHAIAMRSHLAKRLEAGLARHGQVEQQQLRLDGFDHGDRFFAAAGFPDNLKPAADIHAVDVLDYRRRRSKQMAQADTEHALVIGENDRHRIAFGIGLSKLN